MPQAPIAVSPDLITKETITNWVTKYPSILTRVYAAKNPKLSAKEALEEDEWRYKTLPELLKDRDGLTKQQLARLVKWKITHGVYRPFLPGMIQKNTDADVVKHTSRAAAILKAARNEAGDEAEAYKTIEAALKEVMNLTGVGPATGTLVLSIYDPERVPFFADELFAWVVPGHATKLKYGKKEYGMLWKGVREVRGRMKGLGAREVEKAAYAIRHMDFLEEMERDQLLRGFPVSSEEVKEDEKGEVNVSDTVSGQTGHAEETEEVANGHSEGRKPRQKRRIQRVKDSDNPTGSRRSKRVKR